MKNIEILELHLKNFKGIKSLSIPFNKVTEIKGENATGKTSIFDAFTYLLFDKDSTDRKNFEIKTLDENNEPLHGLEHSVTGIFSISGKKKTLQKVYKEKWQKKRGEADSTFTGHETLYYVNDVAVKKSDYEFEISGICDEAMFKLLTSPLYFSQIMKWQDRREVLIQMNGAINDSDIIDRNNNLEPLKELLQDTDIDSLRKILQARKKKLNDDIKSIPFRIDEANNSIQQFDFEALRSKLNEKETRFNTIEEIILNNSKLDSARATKLNKLTSIQNQIQTIERKKEDEIYKKKREAENDLKDKNFKLIDAVDNLHQLKIKWEGLSKDKSNFSNDTETLREEWFKIKQEELIFTEQFICPTCNRLLEASDIDKKKAELQENFNSEKAKNLERNVEQGKRLKTMIEDIANQLDTISLQIENQTNLILALEEQIAEAKRIVEYNSQANTQVGSGYGNEYDSLSAEYNKLKAELDKPGKAKEQLLELSNEKKSLREIIDEIKAQLNIEDNNKKLQARIEELSTQERELSQQIAEVERQYFLTEEFIKTKMELIESEINSRFKTVNFKLFSTNINGGVEPCCEALVGGVPFSDANHGAKVNAGLEIISTLSSHYQISCPVFLDNAESVTSFIPIQSSQFIKLIVSEKDKKLRID